MTTTVRRPSPYPYYVKSIAYPDYSRWVVLVSAVSLWAMVDTADAVEPAAREMLAGAGAGPRFGLHVVHERSAQGDPEQFGERSGGLCRWYPPAPPIGGPE